MAHQNTNKVLNKSQNRAAKQNVNQRGRIDNHTGQSHNRDQVGGAFAGDQNENYLRDHSTKEKARKKQDHDTAEKIIDDDGGVI